MLKMHIKVINNVNQPLCIRVLLIETNIYIGGYLDSVMARIKDFKSPAENGSLRAHSS